MTVTITPEKVEKKPEELVLPVVTNPTFVYKKDTKMFWLGIPVDRTDVVTASFILDSMKMQYLTCFNSIMAEMQAKKNAIVPPSAFNRMRENFVRKLHK